MHGTSSHGKKSEKKFGPQEARQGAREGTWMGHGGTPDAGWGASPAARP